MEAYAEPPVTRTFRPFKSYGMVVWWFGFAQDANGRKSIVRREERRAGLGWRRRV